MRSQSVVLPGGVHVPRIRHAPRAVRSNSWEDVVAVAAAYGLVLDPWQENVLEGAMGERADGLWAAKQIGVSVPRQNGKGAIIEARELAGLLLFGEQLMIHSAHEIRTSQVGFQRIKAYFENFDDLRRKTASIGNAIAREYIRLRTGQELRFVTRSKSAIRGFSADCLLLDEGQILDDLAWEAILYTVSARPNHQIWLLGTPPLSPDYGVVFDRFRRRGLAGNDHRSCWFEWSAPPGSDLDDPQAVAVANPALGDRISWENVLAEREVASDEGFARERLGMWPDTELGQVFDLDAWNGLAGDIPVDEFLAARVVLTVAVARDLSWSCIGMVGEIRDRVAVMCMSRRGTAWVAKAIVEACAARDVAEVVLAGQPAKVLEPVLAPTGVEYQVLTATQLGAACGAFQEAVKHGTIVHAGQWELDQAVKNARVRWVGDAQQWDSRDQKVDDSPLVAVSAGLYRWGLLDAPMPMIY